ncbi:MAG: DUF4278 domain-containing protein [Geitlerinemataceae cyanobacterium]
MQLKYRGIQYEYTPPAVVTAPNDIASHYDGIDIRFRHQHKRPVQRATIDLKYRGVAYSTATEEQARSWEIQREHSHERRQQSMLGRLRSELSA